MKRRTALWLGVGTVVTTAAGRACLWDQDTLKDEIATTPGVLDLVLGQFPHHGDFYYQTRVARLEKEPNLSIEQSNDLAAAYVRLKRFKDADGILHAALKDHPNHYYTLSNLGVCAKKQGRFSEGAKYLEKALKIKPEGHMGLGNWYLLALHWRALNETKNEENSPLLNFLGHSYASQFVEKHYGMEKPQNEQDRKQANLFTKLIRNDQSFADGFVGMGDVLTRVGRLNLSFLAYTRAMMLNHQNPKEVKRRRRTFLKYREAHITKSKKNLRGVENWKQEIGIAEDRINQAAEWLKKYKLAEAQLVLEHKDERKVSIKDVEKRLLAQGVKRVSIL